jgi:hypothetical protein
LGNIDIDHPLESIELDSAVRHFAKTNKLEDDILLRGAHIAKDPKAYGGASAHVSEQEKEALKRELEERNPFRILAKLPKQLRTIIITCSMAAMTQFVHLSLLHINLLLIVGYRGWDQACINGANQYWPKDLGLNLDRHRDVWIFGFINACTYLFASIV